MFGNQKPFGASTGFGTSAFGSTQPTPFGQSSNVFGASAFGSAAPSTSSSLFGGPQQGTGLFGSTGSTFGQPATSTTPGFGFGSPATSTSLFGSSTVQPSGSTGLFGTPTNTFGQPRSQFGSFASTTPSGGGLFGQPQQQSTSLFGQSSTGSTGLFGASAFGAGPAPTGTTIKFKPLTGTDTMMKNGVSSTINTSHQCISCMKEYETKSLEELRLEDYAANRKGGTGSLVGGFGATTQSSLFSTPATQQSAFSFGANQGTFTSTGSSLFGQPSQSQNVFGKAPGFGMQSGTTGSTFGSGFGTGTSVFGQPQQKPLFGQPTSTGLFGAPATTAATGFGTGFGSTFGATTQANAFGTKPAFGAATTSAPSAFSFGSNTSTGSSLFGAKPPAFSFGNTTQSGFGTGTSGFNFTSAANTGTGLFGAPKTTPSFGATSTPAFGTTGFGTTGFGSTLGGASTGTGLFGMGTTNKPTFGFNPGTTGSTFGFGTSNQSTGPFSFGSSAPTLGMSDQNAMNQLQQQQQAQMQQQILLLTSNPYGDNPLFRNLIQDTNKREELLKPTSPAAQRSLLSSQYKVSPLPAAKIKPKAVVGPTSSKVTSMFHGLEDEESLQPNDSFVPRPSIKKLVVKPKQGAERSQSLVENTSLTSPPPASAKSVTFTRAPLTVPLTDGLGEMPPVSRCVVASSSPPRLNLDDSPPAMTSPDTSTAHVTGTPKSNLQSLDDTVSQLGIRSNKLGLVLSPPNDIGPAHVSAEDSISQPVDSDGSLEAVHPAPPHPAGIVLTRHGYFTIPSLDDLATVVGPDKRCVVDGFTVAREGYGNVFFPGLVDVTGLNLDDIVHFHRKEVTIYPDDDDKPPVGEGLNRKAQVTLDCVWPNDKTTHEPIKDPERLKLMGYQEKLERATAKIGAKFVDYRPETGSWVFEVKHFSKYGLEDSDDEMEVVAVKKTSQAKAPVDKATKASEATLDRATSSEGERAVVPTSGTLEATLSAPAAPLEEDREMEDADHVSVPVRSSMSEESEDSAMEPTSPTTQQLAEALGISTEKVQSMKASFFMGDEGDEEDSYGTSFPPSRLKRALVSSRNAGQTPKTLFRLPALRTSDVTPTSPQYTAAERSPPKPKPMPEDERPRSPDFLSAHILLPSASFGEAAMAMPERPIVPSALPPPVPYSESCMNKKQALWIDAACFAGCRFRIGWGPKWAILHPGQSRGQAAGVMEMQPTEGGLGILSQTQRPRVASATTLVTLGELSVSSHFDGVDAVQQKNLEALLEVQLAHSLSASDDGCPSFAPKPGVEGLHVLAPVVRDLVSKMGSSHVDSQMMAQLLNILDLCVALWGNLPGCRPGEDDPATYAYAQARREALSDWLVQTTKDTIEEEIMALKYKGPSHVKIILSHLSGHRVSKACAVAREAREHRLSLLVAQGGCSPITRGILQKQVDNWKKFQMDKHIDPDRLLVYCVLAGLLVWRSSVGSLNSCQNLDWKRALAMHLWYHCQMTSSIADAVAAYEASFEGTDSLEAYSQPPYPPYVEKSELLSESQKASAPYDTCFLLLKLYCDRAQPLDRILTPVTSVPSHLDFRISWLLHALLASFGYLHLSSSALEALHTGFASQLESWGLWPWAAFVVLHLDDPRCRKAALLDLLLRHASSSAKDDVEPGSSDLSRDERFLHEKLRVPLAWIYEAKAARAHSVGDYHAKAAFLIKAESWNEAHKTILEHLATDAVIDEKHDYLRSLLMPLLKNSVAVLNWDVGGQVFLDYLDICCTTEKILKQEAGVYALEKIRPQVMSLCGRIPGLCSKTARDRLCQAEMAKRTSSLFQAIITLQEDPSKCSILHLLIPKMWKLPMPEDYTLDEFYHLFSGYMDPHT